MQQQNMGERTPQGTPRHAGPKPLNTPEELRAWHEKSGLPLRRFFNTSGLLYKGMALKDKLPGMTDNEQYILLGEYGMLVKRPLIVADDFVLVGFREAEWSAALG